MRRRTLVTFIILNILISLGVAYAVISVATPSNSGQAPAQIITVQLVITATRDPNATDTVRIVTATPLPGQVSLPTEIAFVGTLNATELAGGTLPPGDGLAPAEGGLTTALPENCILHTVVEGDTPFGIAEQYGGSGFDLLQVNNLAEDTIINIGDVLIVPLEGCSLTPEEVFTPVPAEDVSADTTSAEGDAAAEVTEDAAGTPRPTLTLAPTAVNASVEIRGVVSAGDVTAEGVEIRNNGAVVDLGGWTMTDSSGIVYTFTEQRLFTNGSVTVYSRVGTDSAIAKYWGQSSPVWEPGDVVTLSNASGVVQSTFRLPSPIDLPG